MQESPPRWVSHRVATEEIAFNTIPAIILAPASLKWPSWGNHRSLLPRSKTPRIYEINLSAHTQSSAEYVVPLVVRSDWRD